MMYLIIRISEYLLSNYEYFAISGAYFWWIAFFCQQFATPAPRQTCTNISLIANTLLKLFSFSLPTTSNSTSLDYIYSRFSARYIEHCWLTDSRSWIQGGFEGNGDYRRGQPEVEVNQRSLLFIKKMFLVNSE